MQRLTLRSAKAASFAWLLACGSCGSSSGDGAGSPDASIAHDATTPPNSSSDGATPSGTGDGSTLPPIDGGLGPPPLGDGGANDPASHGGTITFQNIGTTGWYPSRRDPASGPCDAIQTSGCCMTKFDITTDKLTPWDEDLILTLRGPMQIKQLVTYQPDTVDAATWHLVSEWDERTPHAPQGIAFDGNGTESAGFAGSIGSECLVNVATDRAFSCGSGSVPYCPAPQSPHHATDGWAGSKLFIALASMPHSTTLGGACSNGTTGNWYDAPWIGLSVGELVRAGAFSNCQCYAKDPAKWYLADGCGQFNVFEVVNDNNQYKNLDVFSTNFFGYGGYVGEGPCGPQCDVTKLAAAVDLINKSADTEAAQGAVASPGHGPGAAFRRPVTGYRYFMMLLDVSTRTVALAIVHPSAIPSAIGGLLPALPAQIDRGTIDALIQLRLPH